MKRGPGRPTSPRLVAEKVPPGTLRAARNRVAVHLHHLAQVDFDLSQLAVNCYLQGVRDMVETILDRCGDTAVAAALVALVDHEPQEPT